MAHKVTIEIDNSRRPPWEDRNRYVVRLNGEFHGEAYFNMGGYVLDNGLPLPDGGRLGMPECGLTEIKRTIAQINREARGQGQYGQAEKKQAKYMEDLERERAEQRRQFAGRRAAFDAEHGELIKAVRPLAESDEFVDKLLTDLENLSCLSDKQLEVLQQKLERHNKAAASEWVGAEGVRIESRVVVERIHVVETQWGAMFITTMRDGDGNALVQKGSYVADVGTDVLVRTTVKEHDEFRGEKQTIVKRTQVREEAA